MRPRQIGMTPIYLHRCFPGWEAIRDQYVRPGSDGAIIVWVEREAYVDAKDAETIIRYVQAESEDGTDDRAPAD